MCTTASKQSNCSKKHVLLIVLTLIICISAKLFCFPSAAYAGSLPKGDTTLKSKLWGALGDAADNEYRDAYIGNNNGYIGGSKYWGSQEHGEQEDWCVDFVTYCAAKAGYVEWGNWPGPERLPGWAPQCNTVSLKKWYLNNAARGTVYENDGTYIPRNGDIAIRHIGKSYQHTGVVSSVVCSGATWYVFVVEGNTGSNDTRKSRVNRKTYSLGKRGDSGWTHFITPNVNNKRHIVLDLSRAQIEGLGAQQFTGKPIKPSITVMIGGKKIKTSHVYRNNTNRGTANVVIYGPPTTPHNQGFVSPRYSIVATAAEKKSMLANNYYIEKKFDIYQPAITASILLLTSPTSGKTAFTYDSKIQGFELDSNPKKIPYTSKQKSFIGYAGFKHSQETYPVYWLQSKSNWRNNRFTHNKADYNSASDADYYKKGIFCYAPIVGGGSKTPIYRLFKWEQTGSKTTKTDRRYVYAVTEAQRKQLRKEGFQDNGIAFYVWK